MNREYPELIRLVEVVRRLRAPDGCPWDRAQTHDSIKRNLVEETGEFLDALEEHDQEGVQEELGDLLLQVLLHAQIAEDTGEFDLEDIARHEADKLVRRHPHVFGDKHAGNADEALKSWEGAKVGEAGAQARRKSAMDGVPRNMPGLARMQKAFLKASKCGFEWASIDDAVAKVTEELAEVKAARAEGDRAHLGEELGDLLAATVKLCLLEHFEAEELMHAAVHKFAGRFRYMEEHAGKPLAQCTLAEMLDLWNSAKTDVPHDKQ